MLMENLLRSKEYWQVVEGGVATPEEGREITIGQNREHDAMELKDLRATNLLFQTIDSSILETTLCKETSKDIWDSMFPTVVSELHDPRSLWKRHQDTLVQEASSKNFDHWSIQMKAIFGFQECLDVVQVGVHQLSENSTEAQRLEHKEAMKRDCKAIFLIHQCVDRANFEKISAASSAKEAWETLDKCYSGGLKVKKVRLQMMRIQYELLQMEEQESISKYFTRIRALTNLMRSCGEQLIERRQSRFSGKGQGEKMNEAAKMNQIDHGGQRNGSYNTDSRNTKRRGNFSAKKKKDKSKIQCYNCNNWGHFASECKFKKKGKEAEARLAKDEESDEEVLLMAEEVTSASFGENTSDEDALMMITNKAENQPTSNNWYLDTGCSNHMTGHKEWFTSLDNSVKTKVKFADDSSINVEGIGEILIRRKDGASSSISNVLYVLRMRNNLISLGQLLEKGYKISMEDKILKIFNKKGRPILKAPLSNNRTFKIGI
ncbi:PREDICTED: uncharacterized protein LOC109356326 [Lupinus angustifolius]|uniref:uncharacterized protein LOC109356326 n=1 Tax=Lupinus angustifolius TaxID=3871 RepID=UPI00092F4A49|nr:PREDICTED: uncharacterized protein LOC109356326 [Lupinus angustifolius]